MNSRQGPSTVAEHRVWHCELCGYIYDATQGDSAEGFAPGTPWEALPHGWGCPDCGQPKNDFTPLECA